MYKLVLVDDETEIRDGLKEVIPFEELGFTVVGEAANGFEALQLCEQTEPDLIITDISMPLMDGLTLCRRAKAIQPTLQCIILSGYDDFEYARQAIELQSMGYLLKPISSDEFVAMLQKTRAMLDEEFMRRSDVNRLREHFRESLPMLREVLLNSLLSGEQMPEHALEAAEKLDLDLRSPYYYLALFRTGDPLGDGGIQDDTLRQFAIRNVLSETLTDNAREDRLEVFDCGGMAAALFMTARSDGEHLARLVEQADDARKTARRYLGCALYVGVSDVCDQLSRLPMAYKQALTAMNQCLLAKEEQVLCITDIQQRDQQTLMMDEAMLATLGNSITARDGERARAALESLMATARQNRPTSRAWQTYLMEILMCFLRVVSEQALNWDGLDDQLDDLMRDVFHACPTVDDAEARLTALMGAMLGVMESQRQSATRGLAAEAERYLQENYTREDTSLEELCLHLHISPSYFSMIFKKETRKTFHQYLTDLRMDKALELLSDGEMKIAQVAESVGLPDPSYFSYCFKKHFGYPPSRARNR